MVNGAPIPLNDAFFFSFLVLLLSLFLMLLLFPLGIIVVSSMQLFFPLDVVVVFLNAIPFWCGHSYSSLTSLLLLFPLRHYSFSFLASLLFFNGTPLPTFHQHCSYSSSTLFFLLLFLDVIHVLPRHCSSSIPFLFLNDVPPLAFSRHKSCSSLTSFLLLLFDVTPPFTPLQHFSFSSSMPLLFLLDTNLVPPIASTSLLPFHVVFSFNVVIVPLVLNQYFPPSCFCKCGRSKLSKFNLSSSNQIWRWICFLFFKCLFLDDFVPCFDCVCFFLDNVCHNPNLGLATKGRVYKRAKQEGDSGDTPYTLRSARECEGMNPHTPKATLTWGVGVSKDSRIFIEQLQWSKPISLMNFLYHWKSIET